MKFNIFGRGIKAHDKIIFLDFDGVFVIDNPKLSGALERDKYGPIFNHQCVICLCQIINDTSAKIVVTSSWANYLSLQKIKQMWRYRNLPGIVIDTIRNDSMNRGHKIDDWLTKYHISNYVIIDDMDSRQFDKHHHQHLVTTSMLTGLSKKDIELVCRAMKI